MPELPTTTALLEGLHDAENHAVWHEFDGRYRRVLVALARRMGLGAEDAADIAQDTLLHFVRDYRNGRYRRERGRLGAWIVSIARCRIIDFHRKHDGPVARVGGDSRLAELEDESLVEQTWAEECQRAIVESALSELARSSDFRAGTVEAFRRYALEGRPAREVAEELGMSLQAVYMAKHHCARRLQESIERLEAAYELG